MQLNWKMQRGQLSVPDSSVPLHFDSPTLRVAPSTWSVSPRFAASFLFSLLSHPLAAPPVARADQSATQRRTSLRLDCYLDPDSPALRLIR